MHITNEFNIFVALQDRPCTALPTTGCGLKAGPTIASFDSQIFLSKIHMDF
jgi:hypothetical protein